VECAGGELRCSTLPGGSEEASLPERCDGADEDCDGLTDEDDEGEALRRDCYDGPAETRDVGACRTGSQECRGGAWSECAGQVLPETERCSGVDGDCDGVTDEGFGAGDPCAVGEGGCRTEGVLRCGPDGAGVRCDAAPGEPGEEECNRLDDDCDGETDEGADGDPLTRACYSGPAGTQDVGPCRGGRQVCQGGAWPEACEGEVSPAAEDVFCNRVDDDCDGEVDEGSAPPGWTCVPPTGPEGFAMGSAPDDPARGDDERQHQVVITRPFLISRTEVTQEEWERVMPDNPSWFSEGGQGGCPDGPCDRRPVERVTWYEAIAYCNGLSLLEGLTHCYRDLDGEAYDPADAAEEGRLAWRHGLDCEGYRLPTEAEWEHAARAGATTHFPDGRLAEGPTDGGCPPFFQLCEALARVGWYCGNSGDRTHDVGLKAPNAWGLHDVLGNVEEWVWDEYRRDYERDWLEDPTGTGGYSGGVARSGDWMRPAVECRLASREGKFLDDRHNTLGLRLARTVHR